MAINAQDMYEIRKQLLESDHLANIDKIPDALQDIKFTSIFDSKSNNSSKGNVDKPTVEDPSFDDFTPDGLEFGEYGEMSFDDFETNDVDDMINNVDKELSAHFESDDFMSEGTSNEALMESSYDLESLFENENIVAENDINEALFESVNYETDTSLLNDADDNVEYDSLEESTIIEEAEAKAILDEYTNELLESNGYSEDAVAEDNTLFEDDNYEGYSEDSATTLFEEENYEDTSFEESLTENEDNTLFEEESYADTSFEDGLTENEDSLGFNYDDIDAIPDLEESVSMPSTTKIARGEYDNPDAPDDDYQESMELPMDDDDDSELSADDVYVPESDDMLSPQDLAIVDQAVQDSDDQDDQVGMNPAYEENPYADVDHDNIPDIDEPHGELPATYTDDQYDEYNTPDLDSDEDDSVAMGGYSDMEESEDVGSQFASLLEDDNDSDDDNDDDSDDDDDNDSDNDDNDDDSDDNNSCPPCNCDNDNDSDDDDDDDDDDNDSDNDNDDDFSMSFDDDDDDDDNK